MSDLTYWTTSEILSKLVQVESVPVLTDIPPGPYRDGFKMACKLIREHIESEPDKCYMVDNGFTDPEAP